MWFWDLSCSVCPSSGLASPCHYCHACIACPLCLAWHCCPCSRAILLIFCFSMFLYAVEPHFLTLLHLWFCCLLPFIVISLFRLHVRFLLLVPSPAPLLMASPLPWLGVWFPLMHQWQQECTVICTNGTIMHTDMHTWQHECTVICANDNHNAHPYAHMATKPVRRCPLASAFSSFYIHEALAQDPNGCHVLDLHTHGCTVTRSTYKQQLHASVVSLSAGMGPFCRTPCLMT